jgi:nucleoside phosphorylase
LKYHQADLKEMEAAAVAEACYLSGFKNLILIKAVTNLLDKEEHSEKQFQNNLALASYNLAKQLVRLIAMLVEGPVYI